MKWHGFEAVLVEDPNHKVDIYLVREESTDQARQYLDGWFRDSRRTSHLQTGRFFVPTEALLERAAEATLPYTLDETYVVQGFAIRAAEILNARP